MNQATQQIPSNPALDFANSILEETNGGLEIIDMLHDIAQGVRQNSTTRDRINASRILLDRGLGKCPKQSPVTTDPTPNPAPEPSSHKPETTNKPESPRLVTQLDNALHQSLGPAPSAETPPTHSPLSTNHSPLQSTIQQHILEITNNGRTLMAVLTNICRAPDDAPNVKDSHRVTAGRMLIDRLMGMSPTPFTSAAHPEHGPNQAQVEEEPFDKELWDEIFAELKQKEEAGIITPDPNAPQVDSPIFRFPEDFDSAPYPESTDSYRWTA